MSTVSCIPLKGGHCGFTDHVLHAAPPGVAVTSSAILLPVRCFRSRITHIWHYGPDKIGAIKCIVGSTGIRAVYLFKMG